MVNVNDFKFWHTDMNVLGDFTSNYYTGMP